MLFRTASVRLAHAHGEPEARGPEDGDERCGTPRRNEAFAEPCASRSSTAIRSSPATTTRSIRRSSRRFGPTGTRSSRPTSIARASSPAMTERERRDLHAGGLRLQRGGGLCRDAEVGRRHHPVLPALVVLDAGHAQGLGRIASGARASPSTTIRRTSTSSRRCATSSCSAW